MSTHGSQHDVFNAQSGMPHGGAEYDEGFRPASASGGHGALFDQFGTPATALDGKYGAQWDDFPLSWHEMPALHGEHYDEGYAAPRALTNSGHGTWHDTFRGGAHLRYIADGADYEGTVIDCNREFATVLSREGKLHEVLITNVLAYATNQGAPSRPAGRTAVPGHTDDLGFPASTAEAPSAHSATASGGHLRTVKTASLGDVEIDVAKKTAGAHKPISSDSVMRHRHNLSIMRSAHSSEPLSCPGCGKQKTYNVGHVALKGPKTGTSKMYGVCKGRGSCGFKHSFSPPKLKSVFGKVLHDGDDLIVKTVQGDDHADVLDVVAKTVDSSETAVQAKDEGGGGGGGKKPWCKACQHVCKNVDESGACPTCGGRVIYKAEPAELLDVVKQLREKAGVSR